MNARLIIEARLPGELSVQRGARLSQATEADIAEAKGALAKFFAQRGTLPFACNFDWTLDRVSGRPESFDGKRFDFSYFPKGGSTAMELPWPDADPILVRPYKRFRSSQRSAADEPASDPNLVYRGMSMAEWSQAKQRGAVQSRGDYNLGSGQEGWTFFGDNFRTADHYATGFAPYDRYPTRKAPGVIVAVPRELTVNAASVGAGTDDEWVARSIPLDKITHIWIRTPAREGKGHLEVVVSRDWKTGAEKLSDGSRATPVQTNELIQLK